MNGPVVIDASMGARGGLFTYCPVEGDFDSGDFTVVTGMNYIGFAPPDGSTLVGIIHEDGQEAADAFAQEHVDLLHSLEAWCYETTGDWGDA